MNKTTALGIIDRLGGNEYLHRKDCVVASTVYCTDCHNHGTECKCPPTRYDKPLLLGDVLEKMNWGETVINCVSYEIAELLNLWHKLGNKSLQEILESGCEEVGHRKIDKLRPIPEDFIRIRECGCCYWYGQLTQPVEALFTFIDNLFPEK